MCERKRRLLAALSFKESALIAVAGGERGKGLRLANG
jgi:hypothetical protein